MYIRFVVLLIFPALNFRSGRQNRENKIDIYIYIYICKNKIYCLKIVRRNLYQYDYENITKINEQNCNAIKWNLFAKIRNRSSLVLDTISLGQFIALAVVLRVLGNSSHRIK